MLPDERRFAAQDSSLEGMRGIIADGMRTDGTRPQISGFSIGHPDLKISCINNSQRIMPADLKLAVALAQSEDDHYRDFDRRRTPILFLLDTRSILPAEETRAIFCLRCLDPSLAEKPHLDELYVLMTQVVEAQVCRNIGLMLSGDREAYPLWVLLNPPNLDLAIDQIISEQYVSREFRIEGSTPCVVLYERFDWVKDAFYGLSIPFQDYGFRLSLNK